MIVDTNDYIKITQEVIKYSKDLISEDELESFSNHIKTKLENFNPSIMVYGTYNAGKSSLLNALFGQEEMAKTGDSPETADICGYQYNGFTIYDTPGINAPQEHEEVTREHLDKSEIILFVLSNDGALEEEYIYNKISEIVKANKPLIIVLNNKRGTELDSNEAIDEINKVNVNLSKIGDINGIKKIETKVSICMVNARTALKAKIENKSLLLERSNILQLEAMITKLLKTSGTLEVINALNGYIQNFIINVVRRIDSKIDNKELQKTEELITYLEKYKQSLSIQLKNIVSKQLLIFSNCLTPMLLSADTVGVNHHIDETMKTIVQEIEILTTSTIEDLQIKFDEFTKEFRAINPTYEKINFGDLNNETGESASSLFDIIKRQGFTDIKDKVLTAENVTTVLKKTKKVDLLKNFMKGKGEKWIEKNAEKIAGRAAIALTILTAGYDIYKAKKEHDDKEKKDRENILSATSQSESISKDIETKLFAYTNEITIEIFSDLIVKFKNSSKELDENNKNFLENKNGLLSVLNILK